MIIEDIFKNEVEITQERWKHSCRQHPEIEPFIEQIKQTIQNPDVVKMSSSDKTVRLYYRYFTKIFGGKYVLAVIKTNKRNFLLTTYITDYIKTGVDLWKNKN
ncbi:MAG: hypothetical protein FJ218_07090 [Ignavibacteria bacterium]|nr:hypothetical protein [Ignavibacteria bacterium]